MFFDARYVEGVAQRADADHKAVKRQVILKIRLQIVLTPNLALRQVKANGVCQVEVLTLSKASAAYWLNNGPVNRMASKCSYLNFLFIFFSFLSDDCVIRELCTLYLNSSVPTVVLANKGVNRK